MPNVNDLKESKFLTKNDVDPPVRVTITNWKHVDVSLEKEPEKMKYVLNFKELPKPLVLNNTNGKRIQKITGEGDFDKWIGAQIVLFNDETVEFAGELVGGIRVQVPQPQVPQIAPEEIDDTPHPDITGQANPNWVGDDPPPPTDGMSF